MGYRTGLEIKLTILNQLTERPYVLNELGRRVDANGDVLRRHLEELVALGLVRLKQYPCHARNGQEYTTAELDPSLPQDRFEGLSHQRLCPKHLRPRDQPEHWESPDSELNPEVGEEEES